MARYLGNAHDDVKQTVNIQDTSVQSSLPPALCSMDTGEVGVTLRVSNLKVSGMV